MGVRARVRSFIEELIEAELEEALSRPRYGRAAKTRAEADTAATGSTDIGTATGRAR
jgi:hypothetical protein